ncbi:MAG: hypothetical protein ISS81_02430 [Candidatus Marinimicrobia bacterium]|nr:hypothetical protein [Candidatus Neomarinimicrobiota bacterium]
MLILYTGKSNYNNNGVWDPGEEELHKKFVNKFDRKVEVGMPQTIFGGTLNYTMSGLSIRAVVHYYSNIYVMENSSKVLVANKDKEIFGEYTDNSNTKEADRVYTWSETIQPVTVVDYRFVAVGFPLNVSLHINNILDTEYWQTGDSYGFKPGAARTILLNAGITF